MSVTETLDSKIKAQEEKLKQLKAQRQAALARERAKEKEQARKDDTRRKILLGSWILNKIKHDESFKHHLSDFQQFLNTENKTESNRQKDKDLFKDILFWDD